LPVKHKKGFTGHKIPAKPFSIRFYKPGIPARLLTFGIKPFFFCLPASGSGVLKKTDISDYSGGTVTVFHRVPFAGYTHIIFWVYTGYIKSRQVDFQR
jgi:hypothetical protein